MKFLLLFYFYSITVFANSTIDLGPYSDHYPTDYIHGIIEKFSNDKDNDDSDASNEYILPKEDINKVKTVLAFGKRSLDWVKLINSKRPKDQRIDISPKSIFQGIPFNNPIKNNAEIIWKNYQEILKNLPIEISKILTNDSIPLPEMAPLPDDVMITQLHSIDTLFSRTVRFAGQIDNLDYYAGRNMYDIRGFLNLNNIPNLEKKLATYNSLPDNEKLFLKTNLIQLCHNSEWEDADCQNEFEKQRSRNRLYSFYTTHFKDGEMYYKLFFNLMNPRPEVKFSNDLSTLFSPFQEGKDKNLNLWLKKNVEDEWKSTTFKLEIVLTNTDDKIPHLEFQDNVTAHVNEVGGDTITLDGNRSMEDFSQQWVIRHEYGHVLGFNDCYLEFYDPIEKAMIYYEIDINNIMCSRHGHFLERHVNDLKNFYTAKKD